MPALTDASVGIGVETTYGTAVTPTRWYEFLAEQFDFDITKMQGKGLRSGSRIPRSNRRVITKWGASGKLELECVTRGMGLLWQAALGGATSTMVNGTTYQQMFTLADAQTSLTVQKGVIAADDAGTVQALTFRGCVVDGWELKADQGELVTASFDFDGRDMGTSVPYAAPSYAAGGSLFHFAQGTIMLGGTVTPPTATTLAGGGTPVTNIRSFSLAGANGLERNRYNFGAAGLKSQPRRTDRRVTGKLVAELTDTILRDAVIADTPLAAVFTFTTGETLSTGTAQMQVVCPEIKLSGSMPRAASGLQTISLDFEVLDNGVATQPLWLILRTADTAI